MSASASTQNNDPSSLRATLGDDARNRAWRWVYRPLLFVQLALYIRGLFLLAGDQDFFFVGGESDPVLYENHIGNLSHMAEQPNAVLLSIHMGMALFWVGGVLFQKFYLGRMAVALDAHGTGTPRDAVAYKRFRRAHAILGSSMCLVAFTGCVAGPIIAWQSHGHAPMRIFLLLLPLYFLPAIVQVYRTARTRRYRDHQMWANLAFLAPAVASLWAEALIFSLGRHTPLGSRTGELVGVAIAWTLTTVFIVLPVVRERRAAKASAST